MADKYVVQHTLVGVHHEGEIVTFPEKLGIDIKRLLRIGAIREAEKGDEGTETEFGTPVDDSLTPIPVIPPPEQTTGNMQVDPQTKEPKAAQK